MRGSIRKRGKESWELKWDAGTVNGKRDTRYATVRGTYKDAQRELTRLLNETDQGTLPDPTRVTVGGYLEVWLATAHGLSAKTKERYAELIDRQIVPHLGAIKLQKLKPEEVQRWHTKLLSGGLSARTIGHSHRVLSLALCDEERQPGSQCRGNSQAACC
jgi:integrase